MPSIEDRFKAAAAEAKELTRKPDNDTLLKLYGLYKQATQGDVTGKRPGFTDPVGRAKWDAWEKLKGTQAEDAMQAYIDLVERLKSPNRA
jgi:diazepam-binding inhibitor (GABA receptor modulator, acyl-CoA-binding protein)